MEKLKIQGISSQEYPGGRVDTFTIPLVNKSGKGINHSHIMPLFTDFKLPEEDVWDLDIDFENKDVYPAGTSFFVYINSRIKAWLIVEDETLSMKFDTSLPKEEINEIIEKYFEFPE